ncbi:hypothetical protein EV421DRAFT_847024 [Armillaria borealis]|uniref:Uncharacterized protein n=1 Tax=Armillaria borealis TaxID=47425 RepID=A0AA39JBE0_9AGAR|nr:hypothetical protein EV421DRAFT_847024 [Armillaria borealis]
MKSSWISTCCLYNPSRARSDVPLYHHRRLPRIRFSGRQFTTRYPRGQTSLKWLRSAPGVVHHRTPENVKARFLNMNLISLEDRSCSIFTDHFSSLFPWSPLLRRRSLCPRCTSIGSTRCWRANDAKYLASYLVSLARIPFVAWRTAAPCSGIRSEGHYAVSMIGSEDVRPRRG